ncbi:hypothetical protein BD310DRAFT_770469, partial [Dichomitus squalens]
RVLRVRLPLQQLHHLRSRAGLAISPSRSFIPTLICAQLSVEGCIMDADSDSELLKDDLVLASKIWTHGSRSWAPFSHFSCVLNVPSPSLSTYRGPVRVPIGIHVEVFAR